MKASLVYDGGPNVIIPESMGTPCPDQMQGTVHEQLGELACRICYYSMGYDSNGVRRGRSSEQLHKHILKVQNLSVYEHFNFTVHFNEMDIRNACLNRKGVWVEGHNEITVNLRAVLEWEKYTCLANQDTSFYVGRTLAYFASKLAPQIYEQPVYIVVSAYLKTKNLTENQAWITLYLYGSRGFTHEQVRHRFAISQRSTRYVDESESSWIEHPLITQYLTDETVPVEIQEAINLSIGSVVNSSQICYSALVSHLEFYLIGQGINKTTARKQARGAARGYLGNALASDMLFSAPVSGWKWMLKQRLSAAADAEIRTIYEQVLISLRRSRYGYMFFDEFTLVPSPDGIGNILQ